MGGGYIKEWSYIFKRKQREDIIVFGEKFVVSFLRRFGVEVDVSVVCSIEQRYIGFGNYSIQLLVGLHALTYIPRRYAINLAGRNGDDWNARFFAIKGERKISNKLTGKLQADNPLGAVGCVCHIFKSARLNISDVSCDLSSFGKQFVLFIMAQHSFLNTKVAPKIIVDILVICVEVRCTHLKSWCSNPGWLNREIMNTQKTWANYATS